MDKRKEIQRSYKGRAREEGSSDNAEACIYHTRGFNGEKTGMYKLNMEMFTPNQMKFPL